MVVVTYYRCAFRSLKYDACIFFVYSFTNIYIIKNKKLIKNKKELKFGMYNASPTRIGKHPYAGEYNPTSLGPSQQSPFFVVGPKSLLPRSF